MKNYKIQIITLVVAVLINYSCNDSFLDRVPLDEISSESFWNTENDLLVYNNRIYDLLTNDNNVPIAMGFDNGFDSHRFGIWHLSGFSDDTAPRHNRHTRFQEVRAGKHTVPTSPEWFGYSGWNFLRTINIGLDNYDRANISQSIIDKYAGEARLLRGWFYADKINKFGTITWADSEINIDDDEILYGPRDSRDFVMDKVMEDLNFAVDNLPSDWGDGNEPGRFNKWAALAVKSRVALFEGTWRKYHGLGDETKWLQASADAALELMQNGPYKIFDNNNPDNAYNYMHRQEDLSPIEEIIYYRRYEIGILQNNMQRYHRLYNGGATKSLVEDYLCTDGLPITLSPLYQGDEVYENIFVNRDPRLRQTVLHPEDQPIYNYGDHAFGVNSYPRVQGMPGETSYTGYHIIKTFYAPAAYAPFNTSMTPAITLRLSEALLNYTEAKAELGTLTQADLDMTINVLRDRVDMPHLTLGSIPMDPRYADEGISSLLVEIRRERRLELFMEGFRYDDLRRWKQGKKLENKDYGMRWDDANKSRIDPRGRVTVNTGLVDGIPYLEIYKGTDYENPVFDESKHYLWPLPLDELSLNPALEQNPGW